MGRYRKHIFTVLITIFAICGLSWYSVQWNSPKGDEWVKEVSREQINEMFAAKSDFYLYVGRPTCPDCKAFYPELKEILSAQNQRICYYNTAVKASGKREMRAYVESLGIDEIPMILQVENGEITARYHGKSEKNMDDFSKEIAKGD